MDTSVGPLVGRGGRGSAGGCASAATRTSGASTPTSRSPERSRRSRSRTPSVRRYGRVIQDVTRYAQVGVWEGTHDGRGTHVRRSPPTRGRACATARGASAPSVSARHPGIRARESQDGYGFRHDWLPMQFDDHMLKVQIDQDADGHRHVEESMRVWNLGDDRPVEQLGRARGRHRLPVRHARDRGRRRSRTTDPDGRRSSSRPRRCARSISPRDPATSTRREWGHGVVPGAAQGGGRRARPERPARRGGRYASSTRRCAGSRRTPARSATACTRTCSSACTDRAASSLPTRSRPERDERYELVAVTGRVVGHSMSGSGSLIREYFGTAFAR